jgi:hypothetical protein
MERRPHLIVPFPITTILGCNTASVVARCDHPVRPRYIAVPRHVADDFVITDIKVGRTSQLHSDGAIPAGTLAGDLDAVVADDSETEFLTKTNLSAPPLDMDLGTTIELFVQNIHACAKNFYAVAFCLGVDDVAKQELDNLMKKTLLPKKPGGSLTHEELKKACANIGHDLSCGLCAARFYTGVVLDTDRHDPTCKTTERRPGAPREDRPTGPVLPIMESIAGPSAPDVVEIHFTTSPRWRKHKVQASSSELFSVDGLPGWFRKKDENLSWRWPWLPA